MSSNEDPTPTPPSTEREEIKVNLGGGSSLQYHLRQTGVRRLDGRETTTRSSVVDSPGEGSLQSGARVERKEDSGDRPPPRPVPNHFTVQ